VVGGRWEGNQALSGWGGAAEFGDADGDLYVTITGTEIVGNSAPLAAGALRVSSNSDSVVLFDHVVLWDNSTLAADSGALQINTGWLECGDCDLGTGGVDNVPVDVVAHGQAVSQGAGVSFLLGPRSSAEPGDSDGDGLPDADEATYGTDPLLSDTDGDALGDGYELTIGTDPLVADSDGGGMDDGREFVRRCDPLAASDDAGC
jgi:hypothetical protein